MFFSHQNESQKEIYISFLKAIWWLSNLFSESDIPYLYYRIAEKIFCRSFEAEDLSRSDVSVDARKANIWIWLKTFLVWNNRTFQKIAEFNSDRKWYSDIATQELIIFVAKLRNARITFTHEAHNLTSSMYHCVVREKWMFKIYEESIDLIDLDNIWNIIKKENTILFDDKNHEYCFSLSKSTLIKRFNTQQCIWEFWVQIMDDPLTEIMNIFQNNTKGTVLNMKFETIYLPLYGRNKTVRPQSWLNQWNAWWRERNSDEVYIPVPVEIHKQYPWFFPPRDTPFQIRFPDWEIVEAKICQDWWKALMTNPNKKLWKLLLRDWLQLKQWELATYDSLQLFWIDSVRIDKLSNTLYEINFAKSWSYEIFMNNVV